MKRLLTLFALLSGLASYSWAQQGNTVTIPFAGVPAGSCGPLMLGLNNANGDLYSCSAGSWVKVSGGGGGSGTVSANNTAAGAVANYAAAAGSTTVGPTTLNYVAPTLTVSTSGGGNGALALSGNTSGTATLTAPAVAGTSTNAISVSNVLAGPAGAAATPTYGSSGANGLWFSAGPPVLTSTGNIFFQSNGTTTTELFSGQSLQLGSAGVFGISSNTNPAAVCCDIGFSRGAVGVADLGNGASGNTTGKLKAAGYMSVGTTFTSNAGCSETVLTGGATAGKFTANSTSCTIIITMGDTATAPNGWSCHATDLTTLADVTNPHQTATSATTATFVTGTIVSGDVIQFSCIGY